jgi:hypothetical protein
MGESIIGSFGVGTASITETRDYYYYHHNHHHHYYYYCCCMRTHARAHTHTHTHTRVTVCHLHILKYMCLILVYLLATCGTISVFVRDTKCPLLKQEKYLSYAPISYNIQFKENHLNYHVWGTLHFHPSHQNQSRYWNERKIKNSAVLAEYLVQKHYYCYATCIEHVNEKINNHWGPLCHPPVYFDHTGHDMNCFKRNVLGIGVGKNLFLSHH